MVRSSRGGASWILAGGFPESLTEKGRGGWIWASEGKERKGVLGNSVRRTPRDIGQVATCGASIAGWAIRGTPSAASPSTKALDGVSAAVGGDPTEEIR